MKVLTIPKEMTDEGDLVVLPRSQYERLLRERRVVSIEALTPKERQAVESGRREIAKGKFITVDQLLNGLARPRRKKR